MPSTIRTDAVRRVTCSVRPHDGETRDVQVRVTRHGGEGTFIPDRPGRWWVTVQGESEVAQGCFWVAPRRA